MCGKITQHVRWTDLPAVMREFGPEGVAFDGPDADRIEVATPMRMARVIALDSSGERQLVPMRWGFDAPWERAKLVIHARCETIDTKPTFREAFAEGRRGILVCRTFNEGQEIATKTRQYVIAPKDGRPVAIAVLYQRTAPTDGSQPILTFVMATTPNNKLIGTITDRMPAVLRSCDWPKWLGEEPATLPEVKAMLTPHEGDWDMAPQEPMKSRRPPHASGQGSLF